MNALRLTVALAAALALSPLHANDSRLDDEPQLVSDSQFSAVFDQSESRLTLISDTGNAVLADLHCRDDRPLASGLWLIVRDGLGGYELLAPSVTVLAPGEPRPRCPARLRFRQLGWLAPARRHHRTTGREPRRGAHR